MRTFGQTVSLRSPSCTDVRGRFSSYLDGAVSGVEMAVLATHLDGCAGCAAEFAAWRAMQGALADLGQTPVPAGLQAQLRAALAEERERGAHLPFARRLAAQWQASWKTVGAPLMVRAAGGLSLALVLLGALSWLFAAPFSAVEANDANMAHMVAPRYLYSQVPPQPIETKNEAPVLVDARVDATGRVYDFSIVAGPADDPEVVRDVERNLVFSVFRPATLFGAPVPGHVMMTFTRVSVRG